MLGRSLAWSSPSSITRQIPSVRRARLTVTNGSPSSATASSSLGGSRGRAGRLVGGVGMGGDQLAAITRYSTPSSTSSATSFDSHTTTDPSSGRAKTDRSDRKLQPVHRTVVVSTSTVASPYPCLSARSAGRGKHQFAPSTEAPRIPGFCRRRRGVLLRLPPIGQNLAPGHPRDSGDQPTFRTQVRRGGYDTTA